MFGIFTRSHRVVGIDIQADCIRFLELEKKSGSDRITAYGEVTFDGADPDEAALIQYFKDIKKNLKNPRVHVSIPVGSDEQTCFEILKSAGFKADQIMTPAVPLEIALIPEDAQTSFLIVNVERSQAHYLTFAPNIEPSFSTNDPASHSVISNLNRIYIDWYDRHKERIHHVILAGVRAADQEFLDYVSRETKIPITQANIFVNLKLDQSNVPVINKNDSYKYAVAMGLAMI